MEQGDLLVNQLGGIYRGMVLWICTQVDRNKYQQNSKKELYIQSIYILDIENLQSECTFTKCYFVST